MSFILTRGPKVALLSLLLLLSTAASAQTVCSLQFDGASDYVRALNTGAWLPVGASPRSVEAWVRTDAPGTGVVLNWGNTTSGRPFALLVSGGKASVRTNGSLVQGRTTVNDGLWHHLAATFDGSVVRLYVDGVADTSATPSLAVNTTGSALFIGRRTDANLELLNGSLRDVRIWNTARTAAQIEANMNAPVSGSTPGIVASWLFNEGTGTTVNDRTPGLHHGQVYGATWQCTSSTLTFQVDMRVERATLPPGTVVGVRGDVPPLTWATTTPMTDPDGDGIYAVTIGVGSLAVGSPFQYKFVHESPDGTLTWEELVGPNENGNREGQYVGAEVLPPVLWNDNPGLVSFTGYQVAGGNLDGLVNPGERSSLYLSYTNNTSTAFTGARAVLDRSRDAYVHAHEAYYFDDTIASYLELRPGVETRFSESVSLFPDGDTPDGHVLTIPVAVYDDTNRLLARHLLRVPVYGTDTFPPSVSAIYVYPASPQAGQSVSLSAFLYEGSEITSARAEIRSPAGVEIARVTLYDDGTHGDYLAGDRVFYAQYVPTREAEYHIALGARDDKGNVARCTANCTVGRFTTIPFVQQHNVLFISQYAPGTMYGRGPEVDIDGPHIWALEEAGFAPDVWASYLRGNPTLGLLQQYDAVVWSTGSSDLPLWNTEARAMIEQYLDGGGKLLLDGEDIAMSAHYYFGRSWTEQYLHASFQSDFAAGFAAVGRPFDQVSDGMDIGLTAAAVWPDEITAAPDAVPILTYDPEQTAPPYDRGKVGPARPALSLDEWERLPAGLKHLLPRPKPAAAVASKQPGGADGTRRLLSPGEAGVRVDNGVHRLVYLAFGIETINDPADRDALVAQAMRWLMGTTEAPSLTVQRPMLGASWPRGSAQDVAWHSTGLPTTSRVRIQYRKGSAGWATLAGETDNDGVWRWTLPAGLAVGADYQIRIVSLYDATVKAIGPRFSVTSGAAFAKEEGTGPDGAAGEALPEAFGVEPAYPNPFNPQTTIRYALPEAAHVRLVVFDALGRQVRVLVDGEQPAGYHTAPFDGAGLPSGPYFYRLQAGAFQQVHQMLLLK